MREVGKDEAARMREALKTIAGFANPAAGQDSGQAAARLARETLEEVGLLTEAQAHGSEEGAGRVDRSPAPRSPAPH